MELFKKGVINPLGILGNNSGLGAETLLPTPKHKGMRRRSGWLDLEGEETALKGAVVFHLRQPRASSQRGGDRNKHPDLAHLPSFNFLPGLPNDQIQPETEGGMPVGVVHKGQPLKTRVSGSGGATAWYIAQCLTIQTLVKIVINLRRAEACLFLFTILSSATSLQHQSVFQFSDNNWVADNSTQF